MKWIDELATSLKYEEPRPAPSEEMLARLEAIAGALLPSEFRYFLARYGAAYFGDEDFYVVAPIAEPCSWGTQVGFHTTHAYHGEDLIDMQHAFSGRIPPGVVAFAHDAGGNQLCIDVAGEFPGSVWFWDHEQRWFREFFAGSFADAAREVAAAAPGVDVRRLSVHDIIREWARLHADRFDRPPDYMGMYRMAPTFGDFLRSLQRVPY